MPLWEKIGQYAALGSLNLCALDGVRAIPNCPVELLRDGAGRTPKVTSNLTHGELLKMEAGESHALFGLDLFVVLEWSDLDLRTLQGWQVLLFTFKNINITIALNY